MVEYLPRSAWNARPPNGGPGSLTVSRVQGAVIHWPGTSSRTPIHSKEAVASALRGWQNYHMDVKKWSDIAYQVAVDQMGRAWTLRGLRTQSGANGNAELNEDYGAILLVLIAGEQPTAAMKATVRGVITDFRQIYPKGTAIRPHSAVRPDGTDCPGDAARAAIARGDFTPTTPKPAPVVEDEMTFEQFKNYLALLYGPTGTEGVWYAKQMAAFSAILENLAEMKATLARIEDDTDDGAAAHAQVMAQLAEIEAMVVPELPDPKA